MTLLILQAAIVITFLTVSRFRYGMTRSWSAIYFELEKEGKENWFVLVMIGVSLPLMIASTQVIESMADIYGAVLMNIGGTAIIFSGLAGDTREHRIIMRNHVVGATGGMILAGAAMCLFGLWWITLLMAAGCFIMYKLQFSNHTWFIESYNEALVLIGFLFKFGII